MLLILYMWKTAKYKKKITLCKNYNGSNFLQNIFFLNFFYKKFWIENRKEDI